MDFDAIACKTGRIVLNIKIGLKLMLGLGWRLLYEYYKGKIWKLQELNKDLYRLLVYGLVILSLQE